MSLIARAEVARVVFFIVLQQYRTKEMYNVNSLSPSIQRSSDIENLPDPSNSWPSHSNVNSQDSPTPREYTMLLTAQLHVLDLFLTSHKCARTQRFLYNKDLFILSWRLGCLVFTVNLTPRITWEF